jgi:hypothetical protein
LSSPATIEPFDVTTLLLEPPRIAPLVPDTKLFSPARIAASAAVSLFC